MRLYKTDRASFEKESKLERQSAAKRKPVAQPLGHRQKESTEKIDQ